MLQFNDTSYVEWLVDDTLLYVRFRNVPRGRLYNLLNQLRGMTTHSEWNRDENFWVMPVTEIQKIALIAALNFGKDSMIYVGSDPKPTQMELPFYES